MHAFFLKNPFMEIFLPNLFKIFSFCRFDSIFTLFLSSLKKCIFLYPLNDIKKISFIDAMFS